MATEEEKKKEDEGIQAQLRAAQASLSDAKGVLGSIGDMFGMVFNWGVPALLLGGLLLAGAGPISALIRSFSPEWADKFLDFTEYAKDWINDKTGKKIFTVDEARLEEAARRAATPEMVQGALLENQVPPEVAQAIAPDQQAVNEVLDFMKQRGIAPTQASRMMEPENLKAFIRSHPQTMQRVVAALPQAGSSGAQPNFPPMVKTALQGLLGDTQTRRELLANPQHAQWMREAVTKFGGDAKHFDTLLQMEASDPQLVSTVLTQTLNGVSPQAALTQAMHEQGDALTPETRAAAGKLALDAIQKDDVLGPVIMAVVAKDPSVANELQAVLEKTTDAARIKAEVLTILTAKPERIAALKDVSNEQLASIMNAVGMKFEGNVAAVMSHKPTRDAAVDMLAKLAATNSNGKNELGEMLASSLAATSELGRIGVLASYLQGNNERLGIMRDFKTTIDGIVAARGDEVKPAYSALTTALGGLTGNAPQAAQLAKSAESVPDAIKPIVASLMTNGVQQLNTIMTDDAARAGLNREVDGKKVLYHLGDWLAGADANAFGANAPTMQMLTAKRGDTYPNLDAFVRMADVIDNHSGVDRAKAEGLPATAAADTDAATKTLIEMEANADQINRSMVGVVMAMAEGKVKQKGPAKGADTQYEVEAFGEKYVVTGAGIAEYFNSPAGSGAPKQTVTAARDFLNALDTSKLPVAQQQVIAGLKDHFWVDANNNGLVDPTEGAANFLYDPVMADRLLGTVASGKSQFNGAVGATASAALSAITFGYLGQSKEWNDGEHLAAISESLTKAGVGQTSDTQAVGSPDPVRMLAMGAVPAGIGAATSK